jgi:hypothetical protein
MLVLGRRPPFSLHRWSRLNFGVNLGRAMRSDDLVNLLNCKFYVG